MQQVLATEAYMLFYVRRGGRRSSHGSALKKIQPQPAMSQARSAPPVEPASGQARSARPMEPASGQACSAPPVKPAPLDRVTQQMLLKVIADLEAAETAAKQEAEAKKKRKKRHNRQAKGSATAGEGSATAGGALSTAVQPGQAEQPAQDLLR